MLYTDTTFDGASPFSNQGVNSVGFIAHDSPTSETKCDVAGCCACCVNVVCVTL